MEDHSIEKWRITPCIFLPMQEKWRLTPLKMEEFTGEKGFEPLTFGFGDHYSTVETILLKLLDDPCFLSARSRID